MALNMRERNAEKAEREFELLKAETLKKRDAVLEKYKNAPHPPGLDTDPAAKELGEVTKWFGREVKKIKARYGLE